MVRVLLEAADVQEALRYAAEAVRDSRPFWLPGVYRRE